MRRHALTQIVTILTAFAVFVCFSLAAEPLRAAASFAGTDFQLTEVVYHFQDKAGEPALALIKKTDDNGFSFFRIDFQKFFFLLGVIGAGYVFYSSRLRVMTKNGPLDLKKTTLIKLRI